MKKIMVATGVVALLAAGGAYGYKQHQRSEILASVSPSVKNASIRVLNSSKFETEKTSATFKELFDRLEADTAEIEKRNIEVQSLANKDNAEITDPAVAYMRDCQEFSRTLSMKYRKTLAFSTAVDRVDDILREPMPSSSYSYEYRKERRDKAMEEMNKASVEARAAKVDLAAATKHLKETRAKAAITFPEDALVSTAQLDAVIKANTEEAKSDSQAKPKS